LGYLPEGDRSRAEAGARTTVAEEDAVVQDGGVRIRIEVHDLPGRHSSRHRDVHVGVQRRGRADEVLDAVPADVATASWEFDCTTSDRDGVLDVRGPYVQGGPGARFVYLSWGTVEDGAFTMFGRSKLLLAAVDPDVLRAAADRGRLTGRLAMMDEKHRLRMAAIRPPAITWSAE
jgi:hypothetical protein